MFDDLWLYIVVGFAAQLIDGSLGMAYGVSSNTFLLSLGLPPAMASASVHIAEVGTTAVSGISHLCLKNVNKKLVLSLVFTGVLGGAAGAYLLTQLETTYLKPAIALYLLVMGVRILVKALKRKAGEETSEKAKYKPSFLAGLGLVGGFFDAMGGGGWGPIVTTTLIANGEQPRYVIGSVNTSEFFVTLVQAATFFAVMGIGYWRIILGLLIGGVVAAPFAAWLCKKVPAKALMIIVGIVISGLSVRTIWLGVESLLY
ncbi:sulfite exporter TauE/SafE family protein [bacterium]|nr:sulfite exporter TauE/SafE family protein [bacterium]